MTFETITRHIDESLTNENWFTLNKLIKADLIALCQERGLPTEGSKESLILALMEWKLGVKPIPAPATARLSNLNTSPGHKNITSVYNTMLLEDDSWDSIGEIPYGQLKFGKKLGSGGFKDCFAGTYGEDPVAIGELRISTDFSPEDFADIKHEISVLKQLRHENIVRFIGVCTDVKHLCIVTELCEHGDLFDFMRKSKKPPFSQQLMYMHDIAFGVTYLHTRRPSIIHRDMKSMNILISADYRAKINDFGLARIRPRLNTLVHTQCGTPNWQAPEFWTANPSYTEKVDVYACGLIFWEILQWAAEPYPYHDLTEHQLYIQVRDKGVRPSLAKLKKYPQSLLNLIQDMWAHEPSQRPSMSHVLESLQEYLS
ncbi:kinase-like protein [Basidiobolus meristosporus CBS 931.73]|uniref:Kinase-like protein n=1 Tax=Basidiobolus meristosporus CBS 931.73 TaxID=1314790 RepID=A0A1Y1XC07_9FUNG|nr:kinase-like protein [Basidiobolus meristosporus CBS 931.73]|eukprot:ORX82956.1 kinase-like protein [Basidiobolus meristosporus CBS 931.73]